jgi:hypothetical protein
LLQSVPQLQVFVNAQLLGGRFPGNLGTDFANFALDWDENVSYRDDFRISTSSNDSNYRLLWQWKHLSTRNRQPQVDHAASMQEWWRKKEGLPQNTCSE